ncbi:MULTISPECIES: TonB system transport protein ExbD [Brucella]|jgi:biopolymer transport protein ExbD|uniref:Biopolymer transport protein ExbD n=2 Tax=Brucella TaxID=234 RepID=A0A1A9FKZ5_9HYPH|nr:MULTISPECIES: TonB system transport protein ExbD [Brucella]EMG53754.1 TonB system transport protein ExbD [Ochrobactrum sp. CDB2]MBK0023325.1 TonB system transport protein ExbD [Ochrobactrum sp. S45]MBK0045305.1 TonB system transport protein ExbD [Ochrobactrum sp. S46]MBO1026132.1 TonB system transport protein ExbD [Ochrobactrum sp. SD129]MQP42378.1 TonB system transport protein ExbD [Ochrobactrum sp. MYb237]QWK77210.1 TonB system transport protein ExbD [Ochrobactrum sp. BTU1]
MAGKIREGGGDDLELNHEINVTPFIDVMLVLLIIFMVAAPLATVDINVDLPASSATPAPRPDKPIYVTLKEDLSISVGNDTVVREGLGPKLDVVSEKNKEARVFLRADKNVGYGELMRVMNLLREAGYLKIALVGLETLGATTPDGSAPATQAPATQAPATQGAQ